MNKGKPLDFLTILLLKCLDAFKLKDCIMYFPAGLFRFAVHNNCEILSSNYEINSRRTNLVRIRKKTDDSQLVSEALVIFIILANHLQI